MAEDATLREDSGYLTDSSALPVTRVVIRMSKKASEGYLTIGPLICADGNFSKRQESVIDVYNTCNF